MTALGAASADSAPSRRRAGGGGGGEAHYPGSQHHLHILNPGLAPGTLLEVCPGPHTHTGKAAAAGWGRSS